MAELANAITHFLESYLSPEFIIFLISLLPILELRGGMIAAAVFHMPWLKALLISVFGNMLPIPFILLFIRSFLGFLKRFRPFRKLVRWLENKAYRKGAELMEKHPRRVQLGLFLFVAIPLPGTGAWTGALIASFLGIKPSRSAVPICLGVVGAAAIMSVITYVIPYLIQAAA